MKYINTLILGTAIALTGCVDSVFKVKNVRDYEIREALVEHLGTYSNESERANGILAKFKENDETLIHNREYVIDSVIAPFHSDLHWQRVDYSYFEKETLKYLDSLLVNYDNPARNQVVYGKK